MQLSASIKELLTVFVVSLSLAMVQMLATAGYPGVWLTELYLRLFGRTFPSGIGLGGLFISLVMSFLYPFGLFWGYVAGFRLAPLLLEMTQEAKWGIATIVCILWTLLAFELGYRWALSQVR